MDFESFVLAASTGDLSDEPAAREDADAVEFRLDLAPDPAGALASYDGQLPLIVTNRLAGDGGEAPDTPERLDALARGAEHPAVEAVDVELAAVRDGEADRVIDRARRSGTRVIVSAHTFEGAPDRNRLRALLSDACERGDVGKVAVTAQYPEDVLDLLAVTRELAKADETVATMAMGEVGRHSRAVAPLYGSRIGYAPVDPAEATAPGQYDLATLADLIASLEARSPDD